MTEPISYKLELKNISAIDAIALKQELVRTYQLVDGIDFTWSWYPEVLDEFSYFQTSPKRMEIRFADQATATFFQLRYGQ